MQETASLLYTLYYLLSSLWLSAALTEATTMPDSASSAMTFGTTMSWLNISVSSQTRSLESSEPRKMNAIAMTE